MSGIMACVNLYNGIQYAGFSIGIFILLAVMLIVQLYLI